MALYELARTLNCVGRVTNGVASVTYCTFADWVNGGYPYEVATYVAPAAGGVPAGIIAQSLDPNAVRAVNSNRGALPTQIAIPEGGQCEILLGEAVTVVGSWLRAGGNGAEVDGAAYLADATGDIRIARALETGAVGDIIAIQYMGYSGVS